MRTSARRSRCHRARIWGVARRHVTGTSGGIFGGTEMTSFKYVLFASLLALPLTSCGLGSGTERSFDRNAQGDDDQRECVFTQGYWKNHPDAWPVETLTLGTVTYTKDQLLSIFHTPVAGN